MEGLKLGEGGVEGTDETGLLKMELVDGASGIGEGALGTGEAGAGMEVGGLGIGEELVVEGGAFGFPEAAEAPFNGGEGFDAEEFGVSGGGEIADEGTEELVEGGAVFAGEANGLGGGALTEQTTGERVESGGAGAAGRPGGTAAVGAGGGLLSGAGFARHGWREFSFVRLRNSRRGGGNELGVRLSG